VRVGCCCGRGAVNRLRRDWPFVAAVLAMFVVTLIQHGAI
jgi:hypothetical protein